MRLQLLLFLSLLLMLPVHAESIVSYTYFVATGQFTIGEYVQDTYSDPFTVHLMGLADEQNQTTLLFEVAGDEVTLGVSMLLNLTDFVFENNFYILPEWDLYVAQLESLVAQDYEVNHSSTADFFEFIMKTPDRRIRASWTKDQGALMEYQNFAVNGSIDEDSLSIYRGASTVDAVFFPLGPLVVLLLLPFRRLKKY
ncbi:MAG: hypothetical protein INQ03_10600 [Candidatus Heimdallarchaeota archaeon]|nr:hypothetical protein [Candidatus Heimdallarchaeota archaeon]